MINYKLTWCCYFKKKKNLHSLKSNFVYMMINSYHYIGSMYLIIFCILYLTICCWDALFGKDYYCNATYLYKCLYLFLVTVLWFAVFGGHLQSILKLYFFQNISFNCSITLKDSIAHLEKMWSYVMLHMCIVIVHHSSKK